MHLRAKKYTVQKKKNKRVFFKPAPGEISFLNFLKAKMEEKLKIKLDVSFD